MAAAAWVRGLRTQIGRGCGCHVSAAAPTTSWRRTRLLTTSSARPQTADVVVIGAGVIGTSLALELTRVAGLRTVCLDMLSGAGAGSTSYSSGISRTCYSTLPGTAFAWEGHQVWKNWRDHLEGGRDHAHQHEDPQGYAQLALTGAAIPRSRLSAKFVDTVVQHMDTLNIPYELLSREDSEARFGLDLTAYGPPKNMDHQDFGTPSDPSYAIEGTLYMPEAGYVGDPQLAAKNLKCAAQRAGAEFAFNARVAEVMTGANGRVSGVRLQDGTSISSPIVINAAGPYSTAVNRLVFGSEDVEVENDMLFHPKPYRVEVAYADVSHGAQKLPMFADMDLGIYLRPDVGEKVLTGGIEAECDPHGWLEHPDDMDPSLSDLWTNYVYRLALRLPATQLPRASETRGVVAMYDATPDWIPIYDKSSLPGYYLAIGTSGNQFKNCAPAGQYLTELVQSVENGRDTDVNPIEFCLPRTGNVVNGAIFSRRRDMVDSTKSVMG
eukprot:m.12516 g.12516  ORF g.12516 m.12516 type:complete len:494 (+) comp4276_c0_seq1:150-1631(+)